LWEVIGDAGKLRYWANIGAVYLLVTGMVMEPVAALLQDSPPSMEVQPLRYPAVREILPRFGYVSLVPCIVFPNA
jgi:hypothetical protein